MIECSRVFSSCGIINMSLIVLFLLQQFSLNLVHDASLDHRRGDLEHQTVDVPSTPYVAHLSEIAINREGG